MTHSWRPNGSAAALGDRDLLFLLAVVAYVVAVPIFDDTWLRDLLDFAALLLCLLSAPYYRLPVAAILKRRWLIAGLAALGTAGTCLSLISFDQSAYLARLLTLAGLLVIVPLGHWAFRGTKASRSC